MCFILLLYEEWPDIKKNKQKLLQGLCTSLWGWIRVSLTLKKVMRFLWFLASFTQSVKWRHWTWMTQFLKRLPDYNVYSSIAKVCFIGAIHQANFCITMAQRNHVYISLTHSQSGSRWYSRVQVIHILVVPWKGKFM